jgi:hypothetical protein
MKTTAVIVLGAVVLFGTPLSVYPTIRYGNFVTFRSYQLAFSNNGTTVKNHHAESVIHGDDELVIEIIEIIRHLS